ncbi:hypothetical protein C8R44DRAFT_731257 [Mycena epipterygia]|nr:hypothetical protein C8R44DRAFT_731257 [Mycena epipterygia]
MPTKVMILAQFDHGYYIHEPSKRLLDVVAGPKAWWICFDHRYYIREPLKRLTDVVAWLKALWIHFEHGYYIRETLKWLTDVLAGLRAWWIFTRNPCHCCLAGEKMSAKVVILAQFDHGYYIREPLKRLIDVVAWLKTFWIHMMWIGAMLGGAVPEIHATACLAREELPAKVMILPQFEVGYYIRLAQSLVNMCGCETSHRPEIYVPIASAETPGAKPDAPGFQIGQRDMVVSKLCWSIAEYHTLGGFSNERTLCPLPVTGGPHASDAPGFQFEHGYYIRGTLKWLADVFAWLKAWCIRILYLWDFEEADRCFGLAQGLADLFVILAQFDHGYYIRETLKKLKDFVAWLKAWWIRVSVKQVTDQKSMPLLPRWGGKVVILAQFGHGYYIHGTSKWLADVRNFTPFQPQSLQHYGSPFTPKLLIENSLYLPVTNSKALLCAFSLKMSDEKS